MTDAMAAIRRDFGPADLAREAAGAGVEGVVTVQARQTIQETEWLLQVADEHTHLIRGVVGWAPLVEEGVDATFERLGAQTKLRAIRHVLHNEPDDDYMLRDDFNRGVSLLRARGLAYDILIFERHLPQTLIFVDRHPEQVFILDHVAKPRIRDGIISPWRENITALAHRPNVYCKLSGMVTEADWSKWTPEQLRPYVEVAIDAFGPKRLMFGSDWPVCLLAASYMQWTRLVREFVARLSPAEQDRIMGGTAIEAYRL